MQYRYPPNLRPRDPRGEQGAVQGLLLDDDEDGAASLGGFAAPQGARARALAGGDAGAAPRRAKPGELADDGGAPRVTVQVTVDKVCGALHGHAHAPKGGRLYVVASVVDAAQRAPYRVEVGPHADKTVRSTGLRRRKAEKEKREGGEGGEDEEEGEGGEDEEEGEDWEDVVVQDTFSTHEVFEGPPEDLEQPKEDEEDTARGAAMRPRAPCPRRRAAVPDAVAAVMKPP
jgi:hypothetical protein